MTDYWWVGASDTDPMVANNWSTTSNGTSLASSLPSDWLQTGNDDRLFFTTVAQREINFGSNTRYLNLVTIDSTFSGTRIFNCGGSTLYFEAGLSISQDGCVKDNTGTTWIFTGTPPFNIGDSAATVTNNRVYIEYLTNESIWNGTNGEPDAATIITFTLPSGGVMTLVDGKYPKVTLATASGSATFSPEHTYQRTGVVWNTYGSVDIGNFVVPSTVKVTPSTIDIDDLLKTFKLQGTITLQHEEFNWGNTTVHYTATSTNQILPVNGETTYGNSTTKKFNAKYNKVVIDASTYDWIISDGKTLTCNELIIETDATLYGPYSQSKQSADIHTVKRPTVRGDWNFSQVSDGLFRSRNTPPSTSVVEGGTGREFVDKNSLLVGQGHDNMTILSAGSEGTVLTVSSGVPTWQASTGGDSGGGGTLDIGDLLVENNDSGIIIMGTLVI